ncbi:MAG: hypothetical protein ACKOAR_02340, partial [Bacteroidota bacterium]
LNVAGLAVDADAAAPVRGIAILKLDQLAQWISKTQPTVMDEDWKGYYGWCLSVMERIKAEPSEFKPSRPLPAPPGAPIGQEEPLCGER